MLASAEISRLRVAALAGFGNAIVSDVNTNRKDWQGPFGGTATVDYLWSGEWELGVEHQRSWSERSGTAIGLTGVCFKNFFWYSHPMIDYPTALAKASGRWRIKAIVPYYGATVGISQASIIDKKLNAVGLYVGGKLGLDWPQETQWGLRGEATSVMTAAGSGSIQWFSLNLGAYYNL